MNSPTVDRDSHVAALIRSRQAAEADPDDVAAYFNQALTLCQLGQWEQAVAVWKHVLQMEPDNPFAYVNMGIVLLELEHWEQAEDAFAQAVRCRSDHAPAHFGLGLARAQQGQDEAAKAAWEETLRLDPTHAEARHNLDYLVTMPPENTSPESLPSESGSPEKTEDAQAALSSPLSSNIVSTVQVEYEVTSQISMLPVMQDAAMPPGAAEPMEIENAKAPEENKIKLPPLSGPPLDTIAQSVISAQQDALNGQAAATGQTQDVEAEELAQGRVAPTLRLDSKELQKVHRRQRRQEASVQDVSAGKRSMGKWMAGGAVLLLVLLLAAWKAQGGHSQAENIPPAGSSPAASGVPMTSANVSGRGQSPIPAPAVSTTGLSDQSQSAPADTASAPPASHASVMRTIKSVKPTVKPSPERAAASNNAPSPAPHGNRIYRQRTDTTAQKRSARASETRRKSQETQTVRPASNAATRHAAFHDEDTFPTHSHSGHTDGSDEWTDKIP